MKLWIDDERPIPHDFYVDFDLHLKTATDTINFLKDHWQEVDFISLDHDAGVYQLEGGDYIEILKWLESQSISSIAIHLHSGNLQGIKDMEKIIDRCHWEYYDFRYDDVYSIIL